MRLAFCHMTVCQADNDGLVGIDLEFPANEKGFRKIVSQLSNELGRRHQFGEQCPLTSRDFPGLNLRELALWRTQPNFSKGKVADRRGVKNGIDAVASKRSQPLAQVAR